MTGALTWGALAALCGHFMVLSLLAVGGAMAAAPDMHRYLVVDHGWITDTQFNASIALAQAAPGPNILFVALIGWNAAGIAGALATLGGMLLPSSLLALWATRWGASRRESRGVRAFTTGMAPLTLGLLMATGWILAGPARGHPGALLLVAGTAAALLFTRVRPLWLIAIGAAAGALGYA